MGESNQSGRIRVPSFPLRSSAPGVKTLINISASSAQSISVSIDIRHQPISTTCAEVFFKSWVFVVWVSYLLLLLVFFFFQSRFHSRRSCFSTVKPYVGFVRRFRASYMLICAWNPTKRSSAILVLEKARVLSIIVWIGSLETFRLVCLSDRNLLIILNRCPVVQPLQYQYFFFFFFRLFPMQYIYAICRVPSV